MTVHRWNCKDCDDRLYLKVDENSEKDLQRLTKFEAYISSHVSKTRHQVIHKQVGDFKIKYG